MLSILITSIHLCAQQDVSEITIPESSPFSAGNSIEGFVENSINEVTGKVTFSVPLATVKARSLSYPVSLTYNGATAFDQGKQVNKYAPTSAVGVGFSLPIPKIVADYKGTAARDDDDYYLLDGTNNSKLLCTSGAGTATLTFQLEKYAPYQIRFETTNDRWLIVNEQGVTSTYGGGANSRENVIAWGNWIGNTKNTSGAGYHTTAWNISKIQDQWGNTLTFTYDETNQKINNASSLTHTEASYLKQITSSSGGKIVLNYGSKDFREYYEPHREASEPDAYQEQYEKKYLQSVKTYDNDDQLVYTYDMGHTFNNLNLDNWKRYLSRITQKDKNGNALPSQDFEYYFSGTYMGGIEKITYPAGGSVSYTYESKYLLNNTANRYSGSVPSSSGYIFHGLYVRDNYVLRLYRSQNTISGNKYRFKMVRHWWNGENWLSNEFIFPYLLSDEWQQGKVMDQFLSVFEDDFYAFVYFERDQTVDKAQLYLFHLENDGLTWKETYYPNITAEAKNDKTEDPVLLSGEDFVALATHRTGRLHTYVWNGNAWNAKTIQQGNGQYYFAAYNNYIMVLDEDGGNDMLTGAYYSDRYYFHYLDIEKRWRSRTWSASIRNLSNITGTNSPSYLYPYNNMIGFVADNNPEFVLRWDTYYHLVGVDDIFGSHSDSYPMYPSMGSMMTLQNSWYNSFPEISARFNGSSWNTIDQNPNNYNSYGSTAFGEDMVFMYNRIQNNQYKVSFSFYNPNTNLWDTGIFGHTTPWSPYYHLAVSYNQDFFVAGNRIGKFNNTASKYDGLLSFGGDNYLTYSNTLNYSFIGVSNGDNYDEGRLYRVNKETGDINYIDLGYKTYATGQGASKFGGYNHFLSTKSMFLRSFGGSSFSTYLYRILDDEVNKSIYDITVSNVEIDNGKNEVRITDYAYSNPNTLPDGESTFYGKVTLKNKGYGYGNIGSIEKYFNTGEDDVQLAGLPKKEILKDNSGDQVGESETIWQKYTKNYINTEYKTVGIGYYLRPIQTIQKTKYDGQDVIITTNNVYNTYGLLSSSYSNNSLGQTESTLTRYAYQEYSFVLDKNILSFPYETKINVGSETIAIEQSIWKSDSGKAYAYQNKSGTSASNLRINNETTKVDGFGNGQESQNGHDIYKTTLYSYGHLYPVATITNATFTEVDDELDVSYGSLQYLSNSALETELKKLYGRLPQAMINLNFYDSQGRVIRTLDEREEAVNFSYDSFGRLEYTTDANNKVIEKKEYHYGTN